MRRRSRRRCRTRLPGTPAGPRRRRPTNMRAGGQLTTRTGNVAAASAQGSVASNPCAQQHDAVGSEADHRHQRGQPVVAVHEVVQVERPRGGQRREQRRTAIGTAACPIAAIASANHSDAKAWTESRGTIATPRMSSSNDTPASNSHGTPQTPIASAALAGATAAIGRKPAQIASPPTRGMGTVCKLRALRVGERQARCANAAAPPSLPPRPAPR